MIVSRGVYNSNPVISFSKTQDDRYPFSFGLSKAKIILDHIEDIRKFVEEEDTKKKSNTNGE